MKKLSFVILLAACPWVSNAQTSGLKIEPRGAAVITRTPTSAPRPSFVVQDRDGQKVAQGYFHNQPSAALAVGFSVSGSTLVHIATGVSFPDSYSGCKRGHIHAGEIDSVSADLSAFVEYDCSEQVPLNYVSVRVFRYDHTKFDATSAGVLARSASQVDVMATAIVDVPCAVGAAPAGSPGVDLVRVQCGARWRRPSSDESLYGTATVATAAPHVFVGFTNTCIDTQCANRPAFGAFVQGFDLTSMKRD